MRLTHSKTASRRAHHGKKMPRLVATKTGVRRRHFVDPETGMYRGKQIISIGESDVKKPVKAEKKKEEVSKKAKADKEE
jgi:ribosomal protein L32